MDENLFSPKLQVIFLFGHEAYLGESSEADIRPSLYNLTLSTILIFFLELHILENFVFQIVLV